LKRIGEVGWFGSNDVIKETINSEDVLLEIPSLRLSAKALV
jgi:hypothetical protein